MHALSDVRLLAPVPRPGKLVCIGLNYRDHAAESKGEVPVSPLTFSKYVTAVQHPGAPIVPQMAAYATDGSVFRGAGIPTYGVSGIFLKDSESFSHGLDERVPVRSFYRGLTHWYMLIKELAGGPGQR